MKLMALCILAATVMLAFVQFEGKSAKHSKGDSTMLANTKKGKFIKDSVVRSIDPLTGKIDTLYHRIDTVKTASVQW